MTSTKSKFIYMYWFGQYTYEQYYFLTEISESLYPTAFSFACRYSFFVHKCIIYLVFRYGHKSRVQHWLEIIKSTTTIYKVAQSKFLLATMRTSDSQVERLSMFKLCMAWLSPCDIFTAFLDDSWEVLRIIIRIIIRK